MESGDEREEKYANCLLVQVREIRNNTLTVNVLSEEVVQGVLLPGIASRQTVAGLPD